MIYVSLNNCTPDPERTIAAAARLSTSEVAKVAPRLAAELKPKCYRLGYCGAAESYGIFPTAKEGMRQQK
jgi:hypothetical protein